MPPTPENLIINPQTIQIQTPQVQEQIAPQPEYQEAQVSMPAPQQWVGAVDYGFDWAAVGSKGLEVAGKIYESLLQYSQRRRKEYAQDDMNNIQSIAVEKPDPTLNAYGLENFYKSQRSKLKTATRNALKKQGFSEEQIMSMLPENGEPTLNPSDLQLPSSDMENLLQLTRYNTLTDQEFSNSIAKYNNEIFETAYENFLDSGIKQFGAANPDTTPADLVANYAEVRQRLLDATNNKQNREEIAFRAIDQYPITNYLIRSVENVDKKLAVVREKQTQAAFESFWEGEISEDTFINTVLKLQEQKKKDLFAVISSIDPTIDVESTIEQRNKERINEKPDVAFELKTARVSSIDQNIVALSEQIQEETNISKITELQTQQQFLVKQREGLIKDIVENTPKVLLNQSNQSLYLNLNKQYNEQVSASAEEQVKQITSQTVSQNIVRYNALLSEIQQTREQIQDFKSATKTNRVPTKQKFLELNGVSAEEELTKAQRIVYSILPVDDNEKTVLNSLDAAGSMNYLQTLAIKRSLEEAGIYVDNKGNPIFENEAQRLFYNHVLDIKAAGTKNTGVQLEVKNQINQKNQSVTENDSLIRLASGGLGMSQPDVSKVQETAITRVFTEQNPSPTTINAVFKKYARSGALTLAFNLNSKIGQERFMELALQNSEGFDRLDLIRYSHQVTQDALTMGTSNTDRESLLKLSRFLNFATLKIPGGTQQEVGVVTKVNPQVFVNEFEAFENRYQQTLRTLNSGVADKDLISVYQAAVSSYGSGKGLTIGGNKLWDVLNKHPQFQSALELYSEQLGKDFYFDTTQLQYIVENSNDQDDILTPFVIAQVTAPQGSTPEQIVEQAMAIFPMYGNRLGKTIGSDNTIVPIVTKDPHGKLQHRPGDVLSPRLGDSEISVDPVIATSRTYESLQYGKIPNTVYKEGKQYFPETKEEQDKYKITRDNMYQILASAYPGMVSIEEIKQDRTTVDVLDALMDLFDKYPTVEERLKHYDKRLDTWVYQYQADKTRKDAPSVITRSNWLISVLTSDNLTGKHVLELGLNAPSHVGLNRNKEELNILRRFYRLEEFSGTPLRMSDQKYQAELQNPDSVLTNSDGITVAEPGFGEQVILRHPVTQEKINLNLSEKTSFVVGFNKEMEKPFDEEWLKSQEGTVWEWWDIVDNKPLTTLFPTNTNKQYDPTTRLMESIDWDSEVNAFKYTYVSAGQDEVGTVKTTYLMPRRLKKQADNTPKYDTILRNQVYQDQQGTIKIKANESQTRQISPGAVSEKPYIDLISEFEGIKTDAYWDDTGKVWTIGKGTTTYRDGTPVKKGDKISKEEADNLMQDFIDTKIIPKLEETIPTWNEMNPNQQASLISFAYNVGPNFYNRGGFESITKALSSVDNFNQVPEALKKYNKSGGKVLNGLTRRRKAEAALFIK